MNQIVVGVDFSKTSLVALEYAICIANKTNKDLLLVNVAKKGDFETFVKIDDKSPKKEKENNLDDLVEKYKDKVNGKIEYAIREGKIYEELSNQAKYSDAWLIITGAHGLSGFDELWVGNNTYKIMSHAHCPVIAVRQGCDANKGPQNIILPIDSTLETIQKVKFTAEFAKIFDSTIHLLSLYSSLIPHVEEKVNLNTREAVEEIKKTGVKFIQEKAVSENITDSAIEYAKEKDGDLISIMTEQEFVPGNIFLGPYAEQMVNKSPIPVMSFQTKILKKDDSPI